MLTPQQLRHYLKDFEITDADGFRIKTILSEKAAFPIEDAEETAKYMRLSSIPSAKPIRHH